MHTRVIVVQFNENYSNAPTTISAGLNPNSILSNIPDNMNPSQYHLPVHTIQVQSAILLTPTFHVPGRFSVSGCNAVVSNKRPKGCAMKNFTKPGSTIRRRICGAGGMA